MNALRAAALAAVASLVPVALAGDASYAFGQLDGQLQYRRDNSYGGDLGKAQKKELKAILKAIATLEAPSETTGDAVKKASKVTKTLAKAFPGEFGTAGAPQPLAGFLSTILDYLYDDVYLGEYTPASAGAFGLPEGSAREKAISILGDAGRALADYEATSDLLEASDALSRAHAATLRAQRVVARASVPVK